MPTLLDTHTWIWWVTADKRLAKRALAHIRRATRAEGVCVSAISVWEVAKKVEKRQLVLDRPLRAWLDVAMSAPGLQLLELTPNILIESCQLPAPFQGDPADQIIVASARQHQAVLVTKDRSLRAYGHVQTLW